jgi:hypothetical protein
MVMNWNIRSLLGPERTPTPERQTLTVPIHVRVDKAESQPVLEKAADLIARSGFVWRWTKIDGASRLHRWDAEQQIFIAGSLEDWAVFFGKKFVVRDTTGEQFAGPSQVVCDRLIARVLAHPSTPIASWALQLQRKREVAK